MNSALYRRSHLQTLGCSQKTRGVLTSAFEADAALDQRTVHGGRRRCSATALQEITLPSPVGRWVLRFFSTPDYLFARCQPHPKTEAGKEVRRL